MVIAARLSTTEEIREGNVEVKHPIHFTDTTLLKTTPNSRLILQHLQTENEMKQQNQIYSLRTEMLSKFNGMKMRVLKLVRKEARPAMKQIFAHANKAMLDTGANVSPTYNIELIFNYKSFSTPQTVQTFDNSEKQEDYMAALGLGYLKIESNEGAIIIQMYK